MKIKTPKELFNSDHILPAVGKVTIPKDGVIDVPSDLAEILVNSKIGYSYVDAPKKVKVETPEEETGEDEEEDEDLDYSSLTLDALIEVAKEAGLPEEEWSKLAENTKNPQGLMVKYITKKLK